MELDENNVPEEQEGDYVEIYSKMAIWGFSIFVSPLFGGILLMLNLKAAGYKKAVNTVLIFTVCYVIASEAIIVFLTKVYKLNLYALGAVSIGLTLGGAFTIAEYFFNKYFPENDYYPKSIAKPLLIAAAVLIPYMIIASRIKM
jgi:hypothetical protein